MLNAGEKLKKIREMRGMSQEEVANILNVTVTTIRNYESERRALTIDKLESLLSLYGLSLNDFFSDRDSEDIKRIPIVSKVSAGNGDIVTENIIDYLVLPIELSKKCDFATFVNGDSMYPELEDGEIILIQRHTQLENGNVGVFNLNGSVYVKKFNINPFTKEIKLISVNKEYKDISPKETDDFLIMGRVIGSLKYNI